MRLAVLGQLCRASSVNTRSATSNSRISRRAPRISPPALSEATCPATRPAPCTTAAMNIRSGSGPARAVERGRLAVDGQGPVGRLARRREVPHRRIECVGVQRRQDAMDARARGRRPLPCRRAAEGPHGRRCGWSSRCANSDMAAAPCAPASFAAAATAKTLASEWRTPRAERNSGNRAGNRTGYVAAPPTAPPAARARSPTTPVRQARRVPPARPVPAGAPTSPSAAHARPNRRPTGRSPWSDQPTSSLPPNSKCP